MVNRNPENEKELDVKRLHSTFVRVVLESLCCAVLSQQGVQAVERYPRKESVREDGAGIKCFARGAGGGDPNGSVTQDDEHIYVLRCQAVEYPGS